MKLKIDGVEYTFQKYEEAPKELVEKFKQLKNCDVDGKELKYVSGKQGTFEYLDGTPFTGKRTDVYKMGEDGKVMQKVERTTEISTEQCKAVQKEFADDVAVVGEYFCINENGLMKGLPSDKALVTGVQLSESNENNQKIGVLFRDMDGVPTLRVGATLKSKQKEKTFNQISVGTAQKMLSKKLVKKAELSALGIEI